MIALAGVTIICPCVALISSTLRLKKCAALLTVRLSTTISLPVNLSVSTPLAVSDWVLCDWVLRSVIVPVSLFRFVVVSDWLVWLVVVRLVMVESVALILPPMIVVYLSSCPVTLSILPACVLITFALTLPSLSILPTPTRSPLMSCLPSYTCPQSKWGSGVLISYIILILPTILRV